MLLIFSVIMGANVLFSLPAWLTFRKRVRWYPWDYGVPLYGVVCWIVLVMLHVGNPASLSNIVEVFFIGVASSLSPWIRVAFPGKEGAGQKWSSFLSLALSPSVAFVLRLTMPTLPE